jgi:hypothetical protein
MHPKLAIEFVRFVDLDLFMSYLDWVLKIPAVENQIQPALDPEMALRMEELKVTKCKLERDMEDIKMKRIEMEIELHATRARMIDPSRVVKDYGFSIAEKMLLEFILESCERGSPDPRDNHYMPLYRLQNAFAKVYERKSGRTYTEPKEMYRHVFSIFPGIVLKQDYLDWPIGSVNINRQYFVLGLILKT